MVERNAREPQHVVRQIEGEQRDQPHEGDETPALRIDAFDQPLEKPAGLAFDPVSGDVARDQEGKRGAERGTREVPEAAPDRPKQRAAGEREDRTGNESDCRESIEDHVADRRPQAERAEPSIERRQIDLIAVNGGPRRRCDEQQQERKSRQQAAHAHCSPSRRPSG